MSTQEEAPGADTAGGHAEASCSDEDTTERLAEHEDVDLDALGDLGAQLPDLVPPKNSREMSNEGLGIDRGEIERLWGICFPGLPLPVFAMSSQREDAAPIPLGVWWPDQIDRLVRLLHVYNVQLRYQIYFQLGVPRAEDLRDRRFTVNGRGRLRCKLRKVHIAGVSMLWVDVDGVPVGEAVAMLQAFVPRPTIILFSGSGVWGFWRLRDGEVFNDESAVLDFEARGRWLKESLRGGDSCFNAERIGRLPGTLNWPTPGKIAKGRTTPELARILDVHPAVYTADDFQRVHKPESGGGVSRSSAKIDVDLDALPDSDDLDEVLAPYYVISWCRRAIEHGCDPMEPHRWAKTGTQPPATDRSRALFAVVIDLHRSGLPDELIFSICLNPRHGISAHPREKGGSRSIARALGVAGADGEQADD